MFGIGPTEFAVIIIVAILVLGPEHLPRIMRTVSKVMSEFRKVSTEFQRTMNMEVHKEEAREVKRKAKQEQPIKKKKKKKPAPEETTETPHIFAEPLDEPEATTAQIHSQSQPASSHHEAGLTSSSDDLPADKMTAHAHPQVSSAPVDFPSTPDDTFSSTNADFSPTDMAATSEDSAEIAHKGVNNG